MCQVFVSDLTDCSKNIRFSLNPQRYEKCEIQFKPTICLRLLSKNKIQISYICASRHTFHVSTFILSWTLKLQQK